MKRRFFTKFNSDTSQRGEFNNDMSTRVNPHGYLSVQTQVARAYSAGLRLESWRQGDYDHYDTFDDEFVEPPAYSDPDFVASTDSMSVLNGLERKRISDISQNSGQNEELDRNQSDEVMSGNSGEKAENS